MIRTSSGWLRLSGQVMAAQREHILNADMTKAAQSEPPKIENDTEIFITEKKIHPAFPQKVHKECL